MEVEELAIPEDEAKAEYQALRQAFKKNVKFRRETIRQDLARVYKHLRHGGKIVDVYEAFKKKYVFLVMFHTMIYQNITVWQICM